MRVIRVLHRWTGGLIGLVLAVLGLTGAILAHQDAWLQASLPHAADPVLPGDARLAETAARLLADPHERPNAILFAHEGFGLHRLFYGDGAGPGAYVDQSGAPVVRWSSMWRRPEAWLFDLHRHLFMGKTGETAAGIGALAGLGFVVTGLILWWPARRGFVLQLWPRNGSRAALLAHHRNLGAVAAPFILVSALTGAMMALRPIEALVLRPFSAPGELAAARAAPSLKGGPLAPDLDWRALLRAAQARYPQAELRLVSLPRKPGDLIQVRLRQPGEWTPNGRTALWFNPADGRLVGDRNARTLPRGVRIADAEYPVHAAKVGGLAWRLAITISGLSLAMLGALAAWTFWFRPPPTASKLTPPPLGVDKG